MVVVDDPVDGSPRDAYVTFARYRKAEALAGVLRDFGTPWDAVRGLSLERRAQVELLAGVRPASWVVWDVVGLILRDEQAGAAAARAPVTVADIHAAIKRHPVVSGGRVTRDQRREVRGS